MTDLPSFDFEVENVEFVKEEIKEIEQKPKVAVNHLEIDPVIEDQQWVVLSFLGAQGKKNTPLMGIKVRGSFKTQEQAIERAKQLHQLDPYFDNYVHRVGMWGPLNPDPLQCETTLYADPKLQELMMEHKKHEKQSQIDELNEIAGIHKAQMNMQKDDHRNRVKSKIIEGSCEEGTLPYQTKKDTSTADKSKVQTKKTKTRSEIVSACKDRMKKKLETLNDEVEQKVEQKVMSTQDKIEQIRALAK